MTLVSLSLSVFFPMEKTALLGSALVAVGSEDCNICLLRVCSDEVSSPNSLQVLQTLQGHVSSVKALSCSSCGEKKLLFSGGSRASVKVWTIGMS